MGLTSERLWGLCIAEYEALKVQWRRAQERQIEMLALIRADLHNTAGKTYSHHFDKSDFMPGATVDVEVRARQYRAQGYSASEAAAMACSKQTREQKIHVLDTALTAAHEQKARGKGRRVPAR